MDDLLGACDKTDSQTGVCGQNSQGWEFADSWLRTTRLMKA